MAKKVRYCLTPIDFPAGPNGQAIGHLLYITVKPLGKPFCIAKHQFVKASGQIGLATHILQGYCY